MIFKDGKEIVGIYLNGKQIIEIYNNKRLVYQAVRSCFGNGYWINAKPWFNDNAWRNN